MPRRSRRGHSYSTQYGKGPNSTALIADGKIVTLGFMGHVVCVETKTGKLVWSHNLGGRRSRPV